MVIGRTLSYGVRVHGQRNRIADNLIVQVAAAYDAVDEARTTMVASSGNSRSRL